MKEENLKEPQPDVAAAIKEIDKIVNLFGENPACEEAESIRKGFPDIFGNTSHNGLTSLHVQILDLLQRAQVPYSIRMVAEEVGFAHDKSLIARRLASLQTRGLLSSFKKDKILYWESK